MVDEAGIGVAVEPVRVAGLVVTGGAAGGAVVQHPVDQPQVAVEQVDLGARMRVQAPPLIHGPQSPKATTSGAWRSSGSAARTAGSATENGRAGS